MKNILFAIILLVPASYTFASTYDLFDETQVESVEGGENIVFQVSPDDLGNISDLVLIDAEQLEEYSKKYEMIKGWVATLEYIIGVGTLTLGGLLSRAGYVFYQSKTGKILIKKMKNDVEAIEEDIVENIVRITDLQTGEDARKTLREIQRRLLEIAKEKLPY
jgi:hypothetical protein